MIDLQNKFSPNSICFGCGPANEKGLHIKSIPSGNIVTAQFQPKSYHQAFPNVLNGGIIGTILDCHSNWTAAWTIMNKRGNKYPPCTVTAQYNIKLLKPCPTKKPLKLIAESIKSNNKKATISAELLLKGETFAICEGIFVAVEEGHPAYNRW
tara:strand:- start:5129 stop:5587 length:459 start_codon:yes stop_codon:yes gene_type:complete